MTSPAPRAEPSAAARYRLLAWRILRVPLLAYLLIVVMFLWLENALTYFPAKYPEGDWEAGSLVYEDANFTSADGTKLHGWFVPAEEPVAVVLFCHGNAGNLTHRVDLMYAMQREVGASVLVFDYRGYGRSEGTPTEAGLLADARAARAWLAERTKIRERDVVLMGESIGGAVAVDLAARDGARALVLEDTFTSLPDVAAYHYPWLPVRWCMRGQYNSLAKIGDYHGPLLMAHGDQDTIVPYAFGKRLFEAANEPKTFFAEQGADHNDARDPQFIELLRRFLRDLPPVDAQSSP